MLLLCKAVLDYAGAVLCVAAPCGAVTCHCVAMSYFALPVLC